MNETGEPLEKKKSDPEQLKKQEQEIPLPSKSEIIRQEVQNPERRITSQDVYSGKHDPVIEKPSKSFSIKDIISDDNKPAEKTSESHVLNDPEVQMLPK